MARRSSLSKTFVWVLLGLLFVGLAGFGATNLSGTIRTVARVGDENVSVDQYGRELQREINAVVAQTGQALPMEQVRAAGLDQMVLGRLITLASLDNETAQLGLSIGDENLQREIMSIRAFQGLDGSFSRDSYRLSLQQAGLTEAEFEADLRREAARTLVQSAIVGGVTMPPTLTDVIVEYVGQQRSFTWARLDAADLAEPLPPATEEELRAFYEANIERYTLPETKRITYAWLSPEMILDSVQVDEAALRAAYEARLSDFVQPERRLVERLVFPDEAAARDAMAQIEVGGTTFELLVEQRGLELSDIDLGDVAEADLGEAGAGVFAAGTGQVVGPLPTRLGPALFRVNAVLAAQETTFEEAQSDLRDELAQDRARREIESQSQPLEDMLAGGATLEELAQESEMELGRIDWSVDSFEGIAAYAAFRDAAAAVTAEDFPETDFLEDGSLFAIRLDETLPPRPQPFEEARERVAEALQAQRVQDALAAQATAIVAQLALDGDFAAAGLEAREETRLTRSGFVEGTPPQFMVQVFEMAEGDLRVIPAGGIVTIVRLDAIEPAAEDGDMGRLSEALKRELDQTLAQALFQAYLRDVQLRAEPRVDERALNAVNSSFQ
ncbi:MAG: peptidylprolyl isomerase [Rhodobacteraceae bacterium]|nr:MAG: peptidylprolyl isomerase [Paracoccaceae bacterium]